MSLPLILGALWVLASALVAMLPMRRQYAPGVSLLIAAPVLIIWIGALHGWLWALGGILALASMFRNPFIYFARKALGLETHLPDELRSSGEGK